MFLQLVGKNPRYATVLNWALVVTDLWSGLHLLWRIWLITVTSCNQIRRCRRSVVQDRECCFVCVPKVLSIQICLHCVRKQLTSYTLCIKIAKSQLYSARFCWPIETRSVYSTGLRISMKENRVSDVAFSCFQLTVLLLSKWNLTALSRERLKLITWICLNVLIFSDLSEQK